MKKATAFVVLLFAVASGILALQAEDPKVRKEIQQVYATWDRHVAAGNVKALIQMIDPSFVGSDKDGRTQNYEQAKQMFEGIMKTIKEPRSKITVQQIQTQGDEVVAWVTMTATGKMKEGKKWVPMSFTSKFAETFKKVNGQWKFVASQELP